MRLVEFFYLMGLRPKPRAYGYRVQMIELAEGQIEYARWLNPKVKDLSLSDGELSQLRSFIHEGDFAIDVGAQVGDSTLPIALACGASGLVLALEPNPATFAILEANSRHNSGRINIFPLCCAATDTNGRFVFDYGNPDMSNGGYHQGVSRWRHGSAISIEVEGRRLDEILAERFVERMPRLRYIKVDVNGHDLGVLRSVETIISKYRPFIKTEVNRRISERDRQEMYTFLSRHGYTVHRIESPENLRGPIISGGDGMFSNKTFDIFAVP